MPRPTNKQDLLEQMKLEYDRLKSNVEALSAEELSTEKITTNWSTKDVLAHLAEWSRMALSWYKAGVKGKTPAMPREGFNWRQIPALNQLIYEEHNRDTLEQVKSDVKTTYQQMRELIESLTEQQLFNRAHYSWTKKNNFATYLISASSSHYNWANVRIKRKFKDKLKLKQKTLSIQETAAQRKPE